MPTPQDSIENNFVNQSTPSVFMHDLEMSDDDSEKKSRFKCSVKGLFEHARNSSLFIFHEDWKIRKWCILLLTPVKESDRDELNPEWSQHVSQFMSGYTTPDKRNSHIHIADNKQAGAASDHLIPGN